MVGILHEWNYTLIGPTSMFRLRDEDIAFLIESYQLMHGDNNDGGPSLRKGDQKMIERIREEYE